MNLPLRPCAVQPCRALVTSGYCPKHRRQRETERGTSTARGYGSGWPRLRDLKLAEDPLCEIQTHCGRGIGQAQPAPATEVDHRIPISERPDLRLEWSNLQSSCKRCNVAKSNARKKA